MRKVHEKSIILGIGIGMIITSIAGMIYSAGNNKELSKEEIISLAKGYGMVEKTNIINNSKTNDLIDSSQADDTAAANTSIVDNLQANTTIDNSSTSTRDERNIIVEIKDGDKSQHVTAKLLEKGVITKSEDFEAKLDAYNASTKIKIGTYKFKKNEDLDYIVKTICNL